MSIEVWFGIIVILLIVFGVLRNVLRGKCPKCAAMGSFRKTGMTKVPGNVWGADLFEEYKCAECGHSEWIKQRATLR